MIIRNYQLEWGGRTVLLVNPPIYDSIDPGKLDRSFMQPSGLLRIGSALKNKGADVFLLDCLNTNSKKKIGKKKIENIIFPIYRIGISKDTIESKLNSISNPDEVYISSGMTYWWEGTKEITDIIKKHFPKSKIILGGIYPTLAPKHAEKNIGTDMIVMGEVSEASDLWQDLSSYPKNEIPKSVGIFPSRGCPNKCNYCAQDIINEGKVRTKEPSDIVDEIEFYVNKYGIQEFNIWSDNFPFFVNKFQGFLEEIKDRFKNYSKKPTLNIVKSVDPALLNEHTLEMMLEANVSGYRGELRLALETSDDNIKCEWKRTHTNTSDFERAVNSAKKVGYDDIAAYVLLEAPGENIKSTFNTINYLKNIGVGIIPDPEIDGKTPFTPVPGTSVYKEFMSKYPKEKIENLNGILHPMAKFNGLSIEQGIELQNYISESNRKLRKVA